MAAPHHKLRRKDLKQPDEFQTFFDDAGRFLAEHLAKVVIGAVAVVAVAAIAFGVYFYEAHQKRLAGEEFYQALSALDHKDYKSAEQRFKTLVDNRPGYEVGRLAELYLGDTYVADNKGALARDAFKRYLATDPSPLFKGLALSQLGVVYENLGDFKKARQAYSEAAALPGAQRNQAALASARMLVKMGDAKSAIAAYRQFLTDNPFAHERQDVMEAIADLGASPVPQQASTQRAATKPAAGSANGPSAPSKPEQPASAGTAAKASSAANPSVKPPVPAAASAKK